MAEADKSLLDAHNSQTDMLTKKAKASILT
ncbi:PTS lactose/cellobiose transporter subunit IIA [Lactobacillus delbrueckii subsp. bulgaricus]|nr:PTS lactose/cellobiose transporter subunit IIA [Lactobacillus delbrueckii subsp. bulgaricus]MBO3082013.1 PTS lactose/cellobiose transporter subunit IIA [Lactobacillus delbrueckii subsp. bulgaricus]UBV29814.1 PTS lactose/cellobiose transporter subunit IIA [Lactobacillus delbrueckii subsp. lactis]